MNDALAARAMAGSLRADINETPPRALVPKEKAFVEAARKRCFGVLYNNEGTPFAVGASRNGDILNGDIEEHDIRAVETRWPFDSEVSIYSLRDA